MTTQPTSKSLMGRDLIVGMDNGLKGGLCAISRFDGSLVGYRNMPVTTRAGKSEADVIEIFRWLDNWNTPTEVIIEEPLRHAKSSQAMRSMSISFGKVKGALEIKDIDHYAIEVKEWQDVMLGKRLPKGKTKEKALEAATQYEPEEKWLATPRSRVAHDGIVDAFLIAQYWREKE